MSGLSTKDIKTGGGLPKIIEPGEHIVKINSFELQRHAFMEEAKGYNLVVNVETKPIEGFEGFLINKDNPEEGHYAGQIGQVKTSKFYYRDAVTPSGVVINRDVEILKQLKLLLTACGSLPWFDEADGKYNTIEEFVAALNASKVFTGKYLRTCIAGQEYSKKNNYIAYDLHFAKYDKGKVAYESETAVVSKLIQFDPAVHVTISTQNTVSDFNGDPDSLSDNLTNGPDLSQAPSFEL